MFEIYLVTNQINEMMYVGKTKDGLDQRFKYHKKDARKGSEFYLHRAIRLYGERFFTISPLSSADGKYDANRLEKFWIKYLKSNDPDIGYNMTSGGDGNNDLAPESVEKLRTLAKKTFGSGENNIHFKSEASTEDMITLLQQGLSKIEVGRRLGVSERTVWRRLLGTKWVKKWKPVTLDNSLVADLYRRGVSFQDLRERFGVSSPSISSILEKEGVIKRPFGRHKGSKNRIKKETDPLPCSETA